MSTRQKLFIILVTLVSVGLVTSLVSACWWDGYWGGTMRGGYHPNVNSGASYQNFLNDTAKLRQELAAKQGEYNALMAQPNPDPKRAGRFSQEIASIHDQLKAKAQSYGLDASAPRGNYYNAPMAPYSCYGGGYGGWGCW